MIGAAIALAAIAWATAPGAGGNGVAGDRGEKLFPGFTDPNAAASLEVVEYDRRSSAVRPLKLQLRNGRWLVASQHDYPAEAAERVSVVTAALIALRKDDVASDSTADFERLEVVDPLDAAAGAGGRGTRVTIRSSGGDVLADAVIGRPVANHRGWRYVRRPGHNRTYASAVGDLNVSTTFGDWIASNPLQIAAGEIDAMNVRNYSLNRSTGRVEPGETILLQKRRRTEQWTIDGEPADAATVAPLLDRLMTLPFAAVVPKPAAIASMLSEDVARASLPAADRDDLARKGFYLTPNGNMVPTSGEMVVRTIRGVFYTLRFGEIAAAGAGENRYVFIMVQHDAGAADTPAHAAEGAAKAALLRKRFAPWYYVMAADTLAQIRVSRADLVRRSG